LPVQPFRPPHAHVTLRVLPQRPSGLRRTTPCCRSVPTHANAVALAPMAGVTDLPFRRLCARFGAGLLVGEMVHSIRACATRARAAAQHSTTSSSSRARYRSSATTRRMMAEAARYNVARGAQVIDINMGCPAKKVCRKAAGSALLADERWSPTSCGGGGGRRCARDPENPHRRRSRSTATARDRAHRRGRGHRPAVGARAHTRLRLHRRGRARHHGRIVEASTYRSSPTATSAAPPTRAGSSLTPAPPAS
jgi:hypothetical protein